MNKQNQRLCVVCEKPIPKVRLELLPDTEYCVKCSVEHAPKVVHNPDVICAQPSISNQNGFGAKD
jgi:RNA polymerase-binding transcription factor DksA